MDNDETADTNCNGIWGVDPITGKPWEQLLCKDFDSRGIVYIGDSVGAHFHFPETWINPLLLSQVRHSLSDCANSESNILGQPDSYCES